MRVIEHSQTLCPLVRFDYGGTSATATHVLRPGIFSTAPAVGNFDDDGNQEPQNASTVSRCIEMERDLYQLDWPGSQRLQLSQRSTVCLLLGRNSTGSHGDRARAMPGKEILAKIRGVYRHLCPPWNPRMHRSYPCVLTTGIRARTSGRLLPDDGMNSMTTTATMRHGETLSAARPTSPRSLVLAVSDVL